MSVAEPRNLIEMLSRMEYWRQEPAVERQRTFKRFEVRGQALLEPIENPAHTGHLQVMLRDISRGGVGFVCERFLEPGTVWRIAFEDRGQRVGQQPACVRFCRLVQDGLYLVGAQFVVEPYIMLAAGISATDLASDITESTNPTDTAEYVPPDSLEA